MHTCYLLPFSTLIQSMHFCQMSFPITQYWLDSFLAPEGQQRFPLTYWIEYICLARPYIIWLQPAFPGSSFTSLFFSQSSPFVLLVEVLCLLIFVSAVPKLSPLSFLLYFSKKQELEGSVLDSLCLEDHHHEIPCSLSQTHSPRLFDHPPGQLNKSRTAVSSWKCLLCWYRPTMFPVILLGNNDIISCLSWFSESFETFFEIWD